MDTRNRTARAIAFEMPGNSAMLVKWGAGLYGLDALRGVAALLVLGYHLFTVFDVLPIFSRSYLAVDFFFILSGFVIARTYESGFATMSVWRFSRVRVRRLWGTMAVGTAVGAILWLSMGEVPGFVAFLAILGLLFVPTLFFAQLYTLNRPQWSIFFEMFANLAHRLLLWRLGTRSLLLLAAASLGVALAYSATIDPTKFLVGNGPADFVGGFPRVLASYCLGIVIWRERWRMSRRLLPPVVFVAAILGLSFAPASQYIDALVIVTVFPLLIVGAQTADLPRVSRMLGELSFPLYAVHYPVLQFALFYGLGPYAGAFLALAAAASVAFVSSRRLAVQHPDVAGPLAPAVAPARLP